MNNWHPQLYKIKAEENGIPESVIENAIAIGNRINRTTPNIPIIFNLEHLASLSGIEYDDLLKLTKRKGEPSFEKEPYRIFSIRKKSSNSKRYICVPDDNLLRVQKYINSFILQNLKVHSSSMAYHRGSKIYNTAQIHCKCQWLIKIDIKDFFENISEVDVYNIFKECGYSNLLSFQLSRLCTRLVPYQKSGSARWRSRKQYDNFHYNHNVIGSLPQGAPTSPMLANLHSRKLDEEITKVASSYNLNYTRYSDDISLSSCENSLDRSKCNEIVKEIYRILYSNKFTPKKVKTNIVPPGSRKIVLGVLVSESSPKLTKEFKKNITQHLHFCNLKSVGPVKHAKHKEFDSLIGFKHHLHGLIAHSLNIDKKFGLKAKRLFDSISWPDLPF